MDQLLKLDLESRTLAELLILAALIETLIVENEEPQGERANTFVNRELVRRELRTRGRSR